MKVFHIRINIISISSHGNNGHHDDQQNISASILSHPAHSGKLWRCPMK